jgi:hypothetical protein
MANPEQYAVLQKESARPSADPLRRAFKSLPHTTGADAARMAVGASQILMRRLDHAAAQSLQNALQSEGIAAAIVAEHELPKLPEGRSLSRLELTPQAFVVYDVLGRATAVAWDRVALIAAGAVRHFGVGKTEHKSVVLKFNPVTGVWPTKVQETGHKIESDSQLVLEMLLDGGSARYQIEAAYFLFKHVLDRPELSIPEKFVWLVRELCRHAPQAILNLGAKAVRDGQDSVPEYANRQMLTDEIIWLLWSAAQTGRPGGL